MAITRQIFTLALLLNLSGHAAMIGLRSPEFLASMNRLPPAAGGATFYPTNVPGILAWYVAEDYTTNSGVATWPDRYVNGYALTNTSGGTCPFKTNDGTRTYLYFDGADDFLRCFNFTNNGSATEIFVAMSGKTNANSDKIFDGLGAARLLAQVNAAGSILMSAACNVISNSVPYALNVFQVHDFSFITKTLGWYYTNNVQCVTNTLGNCGLNMGGLVVCAATGSGGNNGCFSIAEIIVYTATLPATNGTYRTDIYNYLTNKYAIVGP